MVEVKKLDERTYPEGIYGDTITEVLIEVDLQDDFAAEKVTHFLITRRTSEKCNDQVEFQRVHSRYNTIHDFALWRAEEER